MASVSEWERDRPRFRRLEVARERGLLNISMPDLEGTKKTEKAKQLQAKMTKATLDEAKAGLAIIDQTWTEAQEAFKGGKLEDAVAKANAVKDKTAEIMTKLEMTVPPAAKS